MAAYGEIEIHISGLKPIHLIVNDAQAWPKAPENQSEDSHRLLLWHSQGYLASTYSPVNPPCEPDRVVADLLSSAHAYTMGDSISRWHPTPDLATG